MRERVGSPPPTRTTSPGLAPATTVVSSVSAGSSVISAAAAVSSFAVEAGDGRVAGVEVEQDVAGRDVHDLGRDAAAEAGAVSSGVSWLLRTRRGRAPGASAASEASTGDGVAQVGELGVGDGDRLGAVVAHRHR